MDPTHQQVERGNDPNFGYGFPHHDDSVHHQQPPHQRVTFVCDFKESSPEILDPRLKPDTRFYQEERVQLLTIESRKFIAATAAAVRGKVHAHGAASASPLSDISDNPVDFDYDYHHHHNSDNNDSHPQQFIDRPARMLDDDDAFLVPPEPKPIATSQYRQRTLRSPRNNRAPRADRGGQRQAARRRRQYYPPVPMFNDDENDRTRANDCGGDVSPRIASPPPPVDPRISKRHGRVQSVKLVSSEDSSTPPNNTLNNNSSSAGVRGKNATVSFIDIRSAAKALRGQYNLGGQSLHIKYYEPNSVPPRSGDPTAAAPPENELSSPVIGGGPMGDANNSPATVGSDQVNSQSQSSSSAVAGHGTPSNLNMSSSAGSTTTSNGPMSANSGNNSIGPPYRHQRFPVQHGQSEDSSHFYDQAKNFNRGRGDGHFRNRGRRDNRNSFHTRHQFQDRNYNRMSNNWNYQNENNRFAPPEGEDRTSGPSPVSHNASSETGKVPRCPESPGGSVSSRHMSRHKSRSVSESGSSDRGSSAGSRSRSGSRSSVSTSASSAQSRSPTRQRNAMGHFSRGGSIGSNSSGRFHRNSYSRQRYSRSQLVRGPADSSRVHHSSRSSPMGASRSSSSSSSSSPHRKIATAPHSPSRSPCSTKSYSPSRSVNTGHRHHSSSSNRRPPSSAELACAIRIRNLPSRSSDSSLKDGLFHEYKKHGKVSWVRISGGNGPGRYAVVCFKNAEQAARAVTVSQDKLFFGCKIQVSPYFEGGNRMNGGGEEVIAGDEENRLNNEDLPSVPYPTRSVLINGLESTVTTQELRQAFEQYGDIVDIRRIPGNAHAVCEFVDIASAIRAQWGRYVFKSREARISFFKSPPTPTLLLDGTANVTEKQVDSHCRQHGAIKNVIMDHSRILALVQFESISSAQTASRELRNWIINRKHLHVDFASSVCTKMFIERLKSLPNDIDGNAPISSPRRIGSLSPTSISSRDSNSRTKRASRKILDDSSVERKSQRRRDLDLDDTKYADELGSSESRPVEFGRQNSENQGRRSHNFGRRSRSENRMSPVSPNAQDGEVENRSEKLSKSTSKIDLNCHETDSAIVTSSSDVIGPSKDTPDTPPLNHESSGSTSSNSNSTLEDPEIPVNNTGLKKRKPIVWSKPKNVMIAVDGVSSTSPEPKNEAVRKVSPDSGTGSRIPTAESIARVEPLVYHMTNGPTDPRKKSSSSDDQRRRASADSAHQEILSTTIPPRIALNSTSVENTTHESSMESPTTDDLDDRPGTPLCDENPESFTSDEPVQPVVIPDSARALPENGPSRSRNLGKADEPLSLPLPEFALQKQSKSDRMRKSNETLDKIPVIPLTGLDETEKEISEITEVEDMPSVKSSAVNTESKETPASDEISAKTREGDKDTSGEGSRISDESVLLVDESPSPVSIHLDDKDDEANSLSSSDSEGRPSRNCPSADQLDQRIKKLYQKYDEWNGNRTAMKVTTVPNSSLNFSLSSDLAGSKDSTQDGEQSSSSIPNKPWFARTKPLSLEEMKHEPSDIVKSLLAKKSVFDEDSKRLENFEEKYEPKSISSINSANWRQALNRSASTPSTASLLSPTLSTLSPSKSPVFPPTLSSHSSSRSMSQTAAVSPSSLSGFGPSKSIGSHLSSPASLLQKRRDSLQGDSKSELSKLNLNLKPASIHSPGSASPASSSGKSPNISMAQLHSRSHLQTNADSHSPKTPTSRPGYVIKPKYPSTNPSESPSTTPVKPSTPVRPQEKDPNVVRNLNIPQSNTPHSSKTPPSAQTPTSAPPQVGIHQGIPRMVERSTSLDSKRSLTAVNASQAAGQNVNAPASTATPKSSIVPPAVSRRPSTEPNPSQGQTLTQSGGAHQKENSKPPAPVDNKPPKSDTKEAVHVKAVAAKEPRPEPSLTILPQKEIAKPFRYENLMKVDNLTMTHEQTVAVVSTVQQTPVLQAQKTSGNNSGNPDKEKSNGVNGNSGKRDKDKDAYLNNKKNHASSSAGNSINSIKPISSNSIPKINKEKKDKEKNSKPVEINNHHNENKKREKEKVVDGSASHSQKKDKEGKDKDKIRRSHSSQEKEDSKEIKKMKLDKDSLVDSKETNSQSSHAHKNSIDRRESAEVTAKVKPPKEKHSSVTEQISKVEKSSKEKADGKESKSEKSEKDHHHKSKEPKTNGSSSSKHHHSSTDKLNSASHNSHKEKHKEKKDKDAGTTVHKEKDKSKSSIEKSEKMSTSSSKSPSVASDGHKQLNHHKKESSSSVSSTKDKVKDREKEKSKISTSSSVFASSIDSDAGLDHNDSPMAKSHSQKEKKDKSKSDKSKNDRRKSGGESSSAPGTADSKLNSDEKPKQKKKRKRIVDNSDSSTDDEQPHHSIFDVVVDDYVSMYDKVKARSNRACKLTPQQQKEEERKQDKLEESFQKLKKSRAKREEKKRSTSTDERRMMTSSDDESHHTDATSHHSDHDRKLKFDKIKAKAFKAMDTSDEEDNESQRSSKPSKSESRSKSKSSSSGKSIKRLKNHDTSPMRSLSYLHSNSDQDSDVAPATKKQKLGSKHQIESMTISDAKSTESDTDEDRKPRKLPKSSSSFLKNKQMKKKLSIENFVDSDNSVNSGLGKKSSSQQSLASIKPKKDKSSKQKSIDAMKKSLFDISNSSDESSKVASFSPKKDKDKMSSKHSSKSKMKTDKENKSHRKSSSPSHSHRPSTSSTSSKKLKTKRKSDESGKPHLIRRESSVLATEADLFGSMSSSNESDGEIKRKSRPVPVVKEEQPPTPPIVSSSVDEIPHVSHKSKHSNSERERKQKKHSSSSQRSSHDNKEAEPHQSSKSSSEKKKRKHHKRSRQEEEQKKSSPEKNATKQEPRVDYSSLFNSPPAAQPIIPGLRDEHSNDTFKSDKLFTLAPPSSSSARSSPSRVKEAEIEEGMKSMFSSDEDEEEDTSLKIGITEAIRSSEDEKPGDENLTPAELALRNELEEKEAAAAAKRLEEEIKRNCLFEQDKAIESILMERKSPAASAHDHTGAPVAEGEEAKDHEPAISQEETDVAVAALLGTLGREDDEGEEGSLAPEKPHGVHSPPTLRIIEEASPSVPHPSERSVSPAHGTPNSPWYTKSPADLQIDEDAGSKQVEPDARSPAPPPHIPKTPEEKFDLLKKFTQEYGEGLELNATGEESDKVSVGSGQSRRSSRQSADGRIRNDIYEFHDSDDEKTRRAKACAVPAPIAQQRTSSDSLPPPAKSPVAATEPVIHLPVISSPEAVVSKPPEIPLHVTIPPSDIKPSVNEPTPPSSSSVSPTGKRTPQTTPPHIPQPPSVPLSVRTSVDDTIDHVIRMANSQAVTMNPVIPSKPAQRGRSRSKSKDTPEDQSAAIAAIISRVSRSGESPKRTTPEITAPPPGEPQINIVPLPKPVIPGLDTRIEPSRTPTQKHPREEPVDSKVGVLQSVVRQPERPEERERPPFIPTPDKVDSDKQFLQQQLYAFKMQPTHVQQQFEKGPPPHLSQQFPEGLAGTIKHQFQQQQQRAEINQPQTSKGPMPSPPVQPKTAIIYTNSEPFVPPKFPVVPGTTSGEPGHIVNPAMQMARPGFYNAPSMYPMGGLKPHEMFSQAPKGFPDMRPPHPTIPNLSPVSTQHSQVQAQMVKIPQIPAATTITKVDKDDQPNRSLAAMQQHPCVIFTSAGQGPVIRTSIPPTHHQQGRPNDKFVTQGPPRVEISGNLIQPSAPSPKAGRLPFPYDPNQPQTGQHRIIPTHLPYEQMDTTSPTAQPLDLASSSNHNKESYSNSKHNSTNNSSSPLSPYLQQSRQVDGRALQMQRGSQDSPQQFIQSPHGYPHYVPVSIAANLQALGGGQPSPTIYGPRPGPSDTPKSQAEMIRGMPDRRPSPHMIPPHIASPASDRGSADSPRLTPSYGRQFFSGTPSQLSISHSPSAPHPLNRQTFVHPYADMEDQGYAHAGAYYQSAIAREREMEQREREAEAEYERRRYASPLPPHIRYGGLHFPVGEAPSSGEIPRPMSPSLASQVPPQGDSLLMLLQRYPIMWQGSLVLKNDNAACQMHFVSGSQLVARDSFPPHNVADGTIPTLKISQRMRLEQTQLDGVARKLQLEQEHCMLLALPCGKDHMDVLQQSNNLRNGFITYLQLKQAAGIVNIQHPESQMPAYVIHIFPSCDFANENLARIAPDLLNGVADIAHLLIVIATV